jgi:hypothetical protein
MLKTNLLAFFIVSCLISVNALAQHETIGFVKIVKGEATVITAENIVKAQPGTPLHLGSILKTGKDGNLGVTFKDNTVMSFGPDTEVTIDEYLYAPAKGDLKLVVSMAKGSLHYISGVIAKLKPGAVAIKTPTGIIGVRGTRFLARAEAE